MSVLPLRFGAVHQRRSRPVKQFPIIRNIVALSGAGWHRPCPGRARRDHWWEGLFSPGIWWAEGVFAREYRSFVRLTGTRGANPDNSPDQRKRGWVYTRQQAVQNGNSGRRQTLKEKGMFHLIWYVLIGLISGVIAKSVMHVHITIFWTIVLGIIGSIIGGAVTHMFSRPANERYHPAGLIFSTLGAILVLFICYKLKIHFPQIELIER
jgi:uncharacterized membrane protein YeaQ/YmgE (transglycosylase-associated protein family)